MNTSIKHSEISQEGLPISESMKRENLDRSKENLKNNPSSADNKGGDWGIYLGILRRSSSEGILGFPESL